MELVTIRIAAREFGVNPVTLRRGERDGKNDPPERAPSGQRRDDLAKLRPVAPGKASSKRATVAYARGFRHDPVEDLVRPVALLESFCAANGWTCAVIHDLGSRRNVRKQGVRTGISHIGSGEGGWLIITHQERLLTFRLRSRIHPVFVWRGHAGTWHFLDDQRADAAGGREKGPRVRPCTLARQTLEAQRQRGEAEMTWRVGEAVREALASRLAVVALANLSHLRGRTRIRQLSPLVSRWMRPARRQLLAFRSEAEGSRLGTVNAAYTSQTCPHPTRGDVHRDNRHGDRFQYLRCGHAGDTDVIASRNTAARVDDPDIHLGTSTETVRGILMGRFRHRAEGASAVTAPGKTRAGQRTSAESEQYNKPCVSRIP